MVKIRPWYTDIRYLDGRQSLSCATCFSLRSPHRNRCGLTPHCHMSCSSTDHLKATSRSLLPPGHSLTEQAVDSGHFLAGFAETWASLKASISWQTWVVGHMWKSGWRTWTICRAVYWELYWDELCGRRYGTGISDANEETWCISSGQLRTTTLDASY
jgi:hypothetical protein